MNHSVGQKFNVNVTKTAQKFLIFKIFLMKFVRILINGDKFMNFDIEGNSIIYEMDKCIFKLLCIQGFMPQSSFICPT